MGAAFAGKIPAEAGHPAEGKVSVRILTRNESEEQQVFMKRVLMFACLLVIPSVYGACIYYGSSASGSAGSISEGFII